jgi:hypothetical protein
MGLLVKTAVESPKWAAESAELGFKKEVGRKFLTGEKVESV